MIEQVVSLNARVEGVGEDVILLHGLFGMGSNLNGLAKALAPHLRVHSLDLRNHGESPHSELMSYESMAADVLHYMDTQNIGRARLFGHSMGGKVAMQLALTARDRITQLLVADISPQAYEHGHKEVFTALNAVDFSKVHSRGDIDKVLAAYIHEPAVRQFLLRNLYRKASGEFDWRMNVAALEHSYKAISGAITGATAYLGEVLFIKGELSNYLLPEHRERILELFPQAAVKVIQNTGHWLHAEKPAAFNLLCINFFVKN